MTSRTPQQLSDSQHRAHMRQEGYKDGRGSRPKRFDDPEYLRSYRRGTEAKKAEK